MQTRRFKRHQRTKRSKKSRKGGSYTQGTNIMGIPIKISKPGFIDGRTCYQFGPINWCTRKST
jgi:hypothetical protein